MNKIKWTKSLCRAASELNWIGDEGGNSRRILHLARRWRISTCVHGRGGYVTDFIRARKAMSNIEEEDAREEKKKKGKTRFLCWWAASDCGITHAHRLGRTAGWGVLRGIMSLIDRAEKQNTTFFSLARAIFTLSHCSWNYRNELREEDYMVEMMGKAWVLISYYLSNSWASRPLTRTCNLNFLHRLTGKYERLLQSVTDAFLAFPFEKKNRRLLLNKVTASYFAQVINKLHRSLLPFKKIASCF